MEPLRRNTVVEEITRKHKKSKNEKNWFNMYNQIQVYCVSVSEETKHNRLIAQGPTKNGNYDITKDTKCNKHNWKEKAHEASEKRVNLLSMHKTTRAAKLYYNYDWCDKTDKTQIFKLQRDTMDIVICNYLTVATGRWTEKINL